MADVSRLTSSAYLFVLGPEAVVEEPTAVVTARRMARTAEELLSRKGLLRGTVGPVTGLPRPEPVRRLRWRDPEVRHRVVYAPQPVVRELTVGSLHVVLDLTPVAVGFGGLAVVGRLLNLVERYWNLNLRIKAEAAYLREHMERAEAEPRLSALSLQQVDDLTGRNDEFWNDVRELRASDGVVGTQADDLDDIDLDDLDLG